MAKIHKLTKNGQTICPATTTNAVVHPDLKVSASKLIEEINISKVFPTGGINGTNIYTLETAIAKIPTSLRTIGLKCSFLNEAATPETWEFRGNAFLSTKNWGQVGSVRISELQEESIHLGYGTTMALVSENKNIISESTFSNEWVSNSGGIADNASCFLSDYIESTGQYFMAYSGRMNGSNPLVVGYNSKKKFLGVLLKSNEGKLANKQFFYVPFSVAYIRAQSLDFHPGLFKCKANNEVLSAIESQNIYAGDNLVNETSNNFISADWSISANTSCYLSEYMEVEAGHTYYYSGQMSGTNPMILGFDNSKKPVTLVLIANDGAEEVEKPVVIPSLVKYIRTQSLNRPPQFKMPIGTRNKIISIETEQAQILEKVAEIRSDISIPGNDLLSAAIFTKQWINGSGVIADNESVCLSDFIQVTAGSTYYYSGKMNGMNPLVIGYDSNKGFISIVLRANDGTEEKDKPIIIPDGIVYIRAQSLENPPIIKEQTKINDIAGEFISGKESLAGTIPQLVMRIKVKSKEEGVRIMCFGSSFFMNTWWYLNYFLKEAGINAEMSCFYTGGAYFSQWINRYENNSAIDCWTSTNGADWIKTSKKFRDTLEESWDIIGYQQGAYQARQWEYYDDTWSKLLSYIRRSCRFDTCIAFNATWPPAVQGDLSPYDNTKAGQKLWQNEANNCFKKFMALSGLNATVVPNGATIWTLRNHPDMKDDAEDLAYGGLHINNGLPMYATAATWFETIIAPMFGVSIETIDWIPTEDTPKCVVSPRYTPMTTEQRDVIRKIIRLSASNRFGFNEIVD